MAEVHGEGGGGDVGSRPLATSSMARSETKKNASKDAPVTALPTVTPTSQRDVRYRASGLVLWRIPEMPPAATDGCLRFQSGPRQASAALFISRLNPMRPAALPERLPRPA